MTVRIPLRDEAELTWFFCHGERRFVRSVHGAIVDRLIRDSMGSRKCPVCHGRGVIDDSHGVAAHKRGGKGNVTTHRERAVKRDHIWTTEQVTDVRSVTEGDWCGFCSGTGWIARKRRPHRCEKCEGQGRRVRAACPDCEGTGLALVNARPVCAAHEAGGVEVDGETSRRFAAISRRLERLAASHRRTLARYWGPHGASWAERPLGRLLGLAEFTPAGKDLLRRERAAVEDDALALSPAERLENVYTSDQAKPRKRARDLLEKALTQAQEALDAAHEAWLRGTEPESLPDRIEAALQAVDATAEKYEAWLDRNPEEATCG